jgi:cytochrome c peroxidase
MIVLSCLCFIVMALTVRPAAALVLDRAIIESVWQQTTPQEVLNAIPAAKTGEMALAASVSGLTQAQLIELGRFIFNNVTFKGNGRTCATCHPPTNNFTIDPKYIATLSKKDPLFVAETNPALKDLENPQLMRSLGLICENVDGFGKPCVFRGVPHTLALRTSTTPPGNPADPTKNVTVPGTELTAPPFGVELANSTGWSADGAPIGNGARGELRLFALGAIVQHFPKTLNRVAGADFRLPSDLELDALLEFQLSLGRQVEWDLNQLFFKNPMVEYGRQMFQDVSPAGGRCAICHNNGGANAAPAPVPGVSGRNVILNTGVESNANPPAYWIYPGIPVDGGFGKPPLEGPPVPGGDPDVEGGMGWGDGTFDSPVVIEAAITPPYFHNNSVATIEAAVGFYCSPEFNTSPPASPPPPPAGFARINLHTDLATSIAAFLRAAGCVELIDRGMGNNQSAISSDLKLGKYYTNIALANTRDAIKVMEEAVYLLYPDAQEELAQARKYIDQAQSSRNLTKRNQFLEKANGKLSNARIMICE